MKLIWWLLIEALIAIAAAAAGWLMPDGLSLLAKILGQPALVVTQTERLLAAMVVFIFAISLQLILTVRSEMRALRDELPSRIKTTLDGSILRQFLGTVESGPQAIARLERLVKLTFSPFAHVHTELLDGYAVIVERALADATRNAHLLGGAGLEVDILDNVEVTQRLAVEGHSYRQIQRRAFLVPQEWTQAWMRLVARFGAQDLACEYIVLMDRATFYRERKKLDTMGNYLLRHHWEFKYCDLQDVLDAFGGTLPTTWNLEVFDNRMVKLQEAPSGGYHGGVTLRMALFSLDERAELRRFNACVARYAKRYSPELFADGQATAPNLARSAEAPDPSGSAASGV